MRKRPEVILGNMHGFLINNMKIYSNNIFSLILWTILNILIPNMCAYEVLRVHYKPQRNGSFPRNLSNIFPRIFLTFGYKTLLWKINSFYYLLIFDMYRRRIVLWILCFLFGENWCRNKKIISFFLLLPTPFPIHFNGDIAMFTWRNARMCGFVLDLYHIWRNCKLVYFGQVLNLQT